MFGDGQECPNQAYVSSWKAFNLHTDKPILAEAFHNKHWITPESNAPESNSPAQENCHPTEIQKEEDLDRTQCSMKIMCIHPERTLQRGKEKQNINKIDWTRIYAEIQKCRNYEEMEVLVDSLDESRFEDLHHPIMAAGPDAVVDPVATYHFPSDGPKNLVQIQMGTVFVKL